MAYVGMILYPLIVLFFSCIFGFYLEVIITNVIITVGILLMREIRKNRNP